MPKRSRVDTLKGAVFILRGVPGSGKTTTALNIYNKLKDRFDYRIEIVSRDNVRKCYCIKHGIDYQASFRDPVVNTLVRDRFYMELFTWLNHIAYRPYCLIIDATNTKIADLKLTLWLISHVQGIDHITIPGDKPYDVYLITRRKEYGSVHDVPECIMKRFREELTESDHWLSTHGHHYNIVVKK